jgi:hypothetical protein
VSAAKLHILEVVRRNAPTMRNQVAVSVLLLAAVAETGVAAARSSAPRITVTPSPEQKIITGSPKRFTGSVRVRTLFDPTDPSRTSGGAATFQPGARSAWHTHPLGQILIVTDGEGWVQQWGEPVQVMHKGDGGWDSARREALARSHSEHRDDSHRGSGESQRRCSELARTGHERTVQAQQIGKQEKSR